MEANGAGPSAAPLVVVAAAPPHAPAPAPPFVMPPPPDSAHAVPPGPRCSIPPYVHQLRRDIRNVDQGSWVLPIASDRSAPEGAVHYVPIISGRAVLPTGMPSIPAGAFMDRNSLLTVICPSSVKVVGSRAFFTCKSLISVTFAHGPIAVNSAAFYACRSLKYVSLPNTLAILGPGAFEACSNLEYIVLPPSLTGIAHEAFHGCRSLKRIFIPPNLSCIGNSAFRACYALTRVTISTATVLGINVFPEITEVIRLPPAKMRAQQLWDGVIDEAVAYKRCRPLFYSWLERAQLRLNSYGEGGAARKRDREEFEGDFAHLV
mmetsp:Transcript_36123/g.120927  ORF Transcript_36123/g.120927 Transcript_36123/m.120927 type:complete len:319 (-) Transcript_36123:251-1207(-)